MTRTITTMVALLSMGCSIDIHTDTWGSSGGDAGTGADGTSGEPVDPDTDGATSAAFPPDAGVGSGSDSSSGTSGVECYALVDDTDEIGSICGADLTQWGCSTCEEWCFAAGFSSCVALEIVQECGMQVEITGTCDEPVPVFPSYQCVCE